MNFLESVSLDQCCPIYILHDAVVYSFQLMSIKRFNYRVVILDKLTKIVLIYTTEIF